MRERRAATERHLVGGEGTLESASIEPGRAMVLAVHGLDVSGVYHGGLGSGLKNDALCLLSYVVYLVSYPVDDG